MTDDERGRLSAERFPDGAGIFFGPARIDAESCDRHEDMAIPSVDRDPAPVTWGSVVLELGRGHGATCKTCFVQNVRNSSGAVVACVFEASVATTPTVGLSLEQVASLHGTMNGCGCFGRGPGYTMLNESRLSVYEIVMVALLGADLRGMR